MTTIENLFYPYTSSRVDELKSSSTYLCHYTSAAVALSIIINRKVWLRNVRTMNDYKEVEHGARILSGFLTDKNLSKEFRDLVEQLQPGMFQTIYDSLARLYPDHATSTYVFCLSEHKISELDIGRLSMWRAYGGSTSTMIALYSSEAVTDIGISEFSLSPVIYVDDYTFRSYFQEWINSLIKNKSLLKDMNPAAVRNHLVRSLHFATLSMKHPGFEEEREWRVIYSPTLTNREDANRTFISEHIEVVEGSPQIVYKIALENKLAYNQDLSLRRLLERIVIGPSKDPQIIRHALISALCRETDDADTRVHISEIPLRR